MHRVRTLVTAGVAASVLLATVGASGAAAEGTVVSLTVVGGDLALDVAGTNPTTTLTSSAALNLADQTFSGALPATTVTDSRGTALAPWTVSVAASGAFVGTTTSTNTIPAANAKIYVDVVDAAALTAVATGLTVSTVETAATLKNLGTPYDLATGAATDLSGLSGATPTLTYTPQMSVTVPALTPADTYSMTVTQTVS